MRILSIFILSLIVFLGCNNTSSPTPGEITLGVYPDNGGTINIDPNTTSYTIGDKFTFTAVPLTGRTFFKWGGTIETYEESFEFVVNSEDQKFIAYFPLEVFNDSTIFLGNYPQSIVSVGEYAYFNFALDLPLDSTFTVFCTCEEFDNFSFMMFCSGDAMNIKVGCQNEEPTIQTKWMAKVKSDKTDSVIADFPINYQVEWK